MTRLQAFNIVTALMRCRCVSVLVLPCTHQPSFSVSLYVPFLPYIHLKTQVAGQSALIMQHSRSFSSMLGQLLDMSVPQVSEHLLALAASSSSASKSEQQQPTGGAKQQQDEEKEKDGSDGGGQKKKQTWEELDKLSQLYVWQQAALQRAQEKKQEKAAKERAEKLEAELERMAAERYDGEGTFGGGGRGGWRSSGKFGSRRTW